ncbi:hypothetical protein ACTWP5_28200 [Streptomyces sp. 4N509B]|uniref:hypothetical protein n=1 Tax=Streptomyces sp. 4N509B TaxID=3457413 RepID=UPI003FD1364D
MAMKEWERAEVIRRYQAGESMHSIGKDFGSRYLIRKVLVAAGIPVRQAPGNQRLGSHRRREVARILEEHGDDIVRLYLSGASFVRTARPFGLNPATVERYLRDRGVSVRSFVQAHRARRNK